MNLDLDPIEVQYVDIDVTATLRDGTPATLAGVDVALLPPTTRPTEATTWTAASYEEGVATALLAGRNADVNVPGAVLTVPLGGADLWILVIDTPERIAVKIGRITSR